MHAFVITLHGEEAEANQDLARLLKRHNFNVSFVRAINGKTVAASDYFEQIQPNFCATKTILSPSEVGCALSHRKACHLLISTGAPRAIILEDDAVLDEEGCVRLKQLLKHDFSEEDFVHLGGQEGLEHVIKNARGIVRLSEPRICEIALDDLCYVNRTVGYLISANLARKLVFALDKAIFKIDDFGYMAEAVGFRRFYLAKIVKHPICLENSSIESERAAKANFGVSSGKPLLKRIASEFESSFRFRWRSLISRIRYRGYSFLDTDFY